MDQRVFVSFDENNDYDYFRLLQQWHRNGYINAKVVHALNLRNSNIDNTQEEIKKNLNKQIYPCIAVVILIGDTIRYLGESVYWEIEQALKLDKPIICANLNGLRFKDTEKCPKILDDKLAVHISFNAVILKQSIENWPMHHNNFRKQGKIASYYYGVEDYNRFGL